MKLFWVMLISLGLVSNAMASPYYLQCEAIGYAYSYEKKVFYESIKVGFHYKSNSGCQLDSGRTHAKNEWHSYFSSEVPEYFKYTLGVKSDCECHDNPPSGVARGHQDFKRDFVRKGFSVKRLYGFDPEDSNF